MFTNNQNGICVSQTAVGFQDSLGMSLQSRVSKVTRIFQITPSKTYKKVSQKVLISKQHQEVAMFEIVTRRLN